MVMSRDDYVSSCPCFVLMVGHDIRLAAERAQRQRRAAKGVYRRQEYRDSLDEVIKEESVALRKKNKLLPSSTHVPFPEHLA
mmetsp:Transcript_4898/g.9207  ORF Transcript_4898/g.9207 Transcript_4898/m.9207 type:complete len:82 (+) Transcript_4898:626-871(+)